jgi:hypothetical protein
MGSVAEWMEKLGIAEDSEVGRMALQLEGLCRGREGIRFAPAAVRTKPTCWYKELPGGKLGWYIGIVPERAKGWRGTGGEDQPSPEFPTAVIRIAAGGHEEKKRVGADFPEELRALKPRKTGPSAGALLYSQAKDWSPGSHVVQAGEVVLFTKTFSRNHDLGSVLESIFLKLEH